MTKGAAVVVVMSLIALAGASLYVPKAYGSNFRDVTQFNSPTRGPRELKIRVHEWRRSPVRGLKDVSWGWVWRNEKGRYWLLTMAERGGVAYDITITPAGAEPEEGRMIHWEFLIATHALILALAGFALYLLRLRARRCAALGSL